MFVGLLIDPKIHIKVKILQDVKFLRYVYFDGISDMHKVREV